MKKNLTPAERREKKITGRIHRGKILLQVATAFLFVDAIAAILGFIFDLVGTTVDAAGNTVPVMNWSSVVDVLQMVLLPIEAVFFVFAAIGAICFVKEKGAFERFVSFAAIVFVVIFLWNFLASIHDLIRNPNWQVFLQSFLFLDVAGILYILGWYWSKDEF